MAIKFSDDSISRFFIFYFFSQNVNFQDLFKTETIIFLLIALNFVIELFVKSNTNI
ncbi:MAG: hypothetical protein AVDCRST_MAG74-1829 [uncultured Pyrinomonadaceae bacterium]|uniref:Uncharacterized protein n=1 Tax=uncultured Pyrinomonadaceae bacterium TaxID=2283094 RepID=A0A6J4P1W1_9BACT|nr:MAG: hypothetical protein AVDCRST_MAG74-1829 [uncultured Pyrinomonadaceae bacterium]